MDDQAGRDASVTRQTVGHLHTLAIDHGKRLREIERHVRDIKVFVFALITAVVLMAAHQVWKG